MADAAAVRKMIEFVTSIPMLSDEESWNELDLNGTVWNQWDWMTAYSREKQIRITEQGVVGNVSGLRCGTAACLAGATVLQMAPIGTVITLGQAERPLVTTPDGHALGFLPNYAARLLGLTLEEAAELFNGSNSAKDLKRIGGRIIGEEIL
jgi:hypothetical protein